MTGSLKPHFKTIVDLRRDNGPAICNVCRQFVALCRDINLLDCASVAIEGSKFKAVNTKAKNFTREKLHKRFKETDERIRYYLSKLDRADVVYTATGMPVSEVQIQRVIDKIARLKKEADKGYYKGEEIVACDEDGTGVTLPKVVTSNAKARGRFDRNAFIYDTEQDVYACLAGHHLTPRMTRHEDSCPFETNP